MSVVAHTSRQKSDINITPLIDIVLVLLIAFIVMVPTLLQSLPAVIPQTVPQGMVPDSPVPQLVVSLDGEGRLLVQQDVVPRHQLVSTLVPAFLKQPLQHRRVFLKVDAQRTHGEVASVMDLVREAGTITLRESARKLGNPGIEPRVVVSLLKSKA